MIASSSKKAKRKTKFDDSYTEKHNFIIKCSSSIQDNSFKFQFTICNVDLSSAHGGINNVIITLKPKSVTNMKRISNVKGSLHSTIFSECTELLQLKKYF